MKLSHLRWPAVPLIALAALGLGLAVLPQGAAAIRRPGKVFDARVGTLLQACTDGVALLLGKVGESNDQVFPLRGVLQSSGAVVFDEVYSDFARVSPPYQIGSSSVDWLLSPRQPYAGGPLTPGDRLIIFNPNAPSGSYLAATVDDCALGQTPPEAYEIFGTVGAGGDASFIVDTGGRLIADVSLEVVVPDLPARSMVLRLRAPDGRVALLLDRPPTTSDATLGSSAEYTFDAQQLATAGPAVFDDDSSYAAAENVGDYLRYALRSSGPLRLADLRGGSADGGWVLEARDENGGVIPIGYAQLTVEAWAAFLPAIER
jgi:hypothetical protein